MNISGHYPTYYEHYDKSVTFKKRVDTVLEWLDLPSEERPGFITMYLHEPDTAGHNYGPFSTQVNHTRACHLTHFSYFLVNAQRFVVC